MGAASTTLREELRETPATEPDIGALQAHFMQFVDRIRLHAEINARRYRCPGRKEDFVAEVIAVSWRWFLRCVEQGKDVDSFVMMLATYAVKHVRCGRRLCGQERAKDVFSGRTQASKGFVVIPLPGCRHSRDDVYCKPSGQRDADYIEEALRDNTQCEPPETAAFRCDFPQWMAGYDQRKRDIVEAMIMGDATQDIAARFGLSPGRISQMRREFCDGWRVFHGE